MDEHGMRLDALARAAGVASTTVRLYQNKGLLPAPRLVGRTGYYDEHHLTRLRLIGRLQDEGFSLAGIGTLLQAWEDGRDLGDLVGVEFQIDALLNGRTPLVLEPSELLDRFPPGAITAEAMQRALTLGLVELTPEGRLHVPDQRFLESGAALVHLGVPVDVVLDEWQHLVAVTDAVASRFIDVFDHHLLPNGGGSADDEPARDLARTLASLQHTARQVILAAFDASIAQLGARRLGALAEDLGSHQG